MTARLRAWLDVLGDQFWLRPALLILLGVALALALVAVDRGLPSASSGAAWGYSGGGEGARALLSAVASSTIGVAGTTFSITIAALTLASNQMGPRLLRNFVRDARNQIALGLFLGTFAYALMVLRTVRTVQEGTFVPHVAISGAIVLALVSVATLVWFVHHVATSINVETIVDQVHGDLCDALEDGTRENADLTPAQEGWSGLALSVRGSNYLQAVDLNGLADFAAAHGLRLRLTVRPGDYVPVGLPIAEASARVEGLQEALERALTFGHRRTAVQDLEFSVRQLTEIAVRALSPGINDPFTAGSVLERLGDVLCRLAPRHLATGVVSRDGQQVLLHPVTTYAGLCDAMFHTIRQNAASSPYVLIRLLTVLAEVASVERNVARQAELRRHVDLAYALGRSEIADMAGVQDLERAYERFAIATNGAWHRPTHE